MSLNWKSGAVLLVALTLVLGVVIGSNLNWAARAGADAAGGPGYTIVETDGTNLLVTDNKASTVYYYTIEPGGKPGDDLHLRGSADLTQVGKPVIKLTKIAPKKDKP